jgi:hypothetical protein
MITEFGYRFGEIADSSLENFGMAVRLFHSNMSERGTHSGLEDRPMP